MQCFFFLPWQTWHFYDTASLCLPEDPITAAMLRTVMTDILYCGIRNLFGFAGNYSLSSMKVHSHLWETAAADYYYYYYYYYVVIYVLHIWQYVMCASCYICINYKVKIGQVIKNTVVSGFMRKILKQTVFTKEVTCCARYAAAVVKWEAEGEKRQWWRNV
jgi:hypothetical protein